MTLATMPGQTNFIAQFNAVLRAEFGLSSGLFGGLYTLATLTSATGLIFAGALADRIAPRKLALAIMAGLAATALPMSRVENLPLLVVALALLRFFGQGMLMHVALTAMARWFDRFRGRALSFAMFGMTLGDSLLPFTLTVSIAAFGWRTVWIGTACALALVLMPLVFLLLRGSPGGGAVPAGALRRRRPVSSGAARACCGIRCSGRSCRASWRCPGSGRSSSSIRPIWWRRKAGI